LQALEKLAHRLAQAQQAAFLCQLASLPTGFKPAGTISTIPTPTPTPTQNQQRQHRLQVLQHQPRQLPRQQATLSNDAFKFGTSGVLNTNTLAGILAASGTTINCDKCKWRHRLLMRHSFTREIVDTQQQHSFIVAQVVQLT
jgi:hypothetical protein